MALLTLRGVRYSIGGPALLDGVQLNIESGERVCLVGRNGEGKSTLMRLIAGQNAPEPIVPDGGDIIWQSSARQAFLPQSVPPQLDGRAFDIVAQGLPQEERDQEHRVATYLTQLKIDGDQEFTTLSGGMQRRVMLARALASDADLLLLDEPTNHLDIESIAWLEEYLKRNIRALLFVTHDRAFLRSVATRIVEIDRGKIASFDCSYDIYLERKSALLDAEGKQQADFDKKLAQEEVWIRKGVKARETRNEGRVRALQKLREERGQRRNLQGTTRAGTQDVEKSGHLVIEAENAGFGYDDKPLIRDFSTTVLRGDKVGILGPNGSGKTTLLKLMLNQLAPQTGTLKMGTRLHLAYFDQNRTQLDEKQTVQWNVCGENSTVTINGERRHVVGYMQEWLFSPDRLRTPVKVLSGGERNRLLLAKLFTQPMNLLVLDEPTNDLDIETLDVLEDVLVNFPGTLIVVSHDRDFLNNVVTSTLSPIADGRWNELIGGYDDYLRQSSAQRPAQSTLMPKAAPKTESAKSKIEKARRMSFKEKQELETLPARIEKLEAEHESLVAKMSDPEFYKGDASQTVATKNRLDEIALELEVSFARWQELEAVAMASL